MTAQWKQVSGSAAEVYERHLAPAIMAPWVPALLDRANIQPGEHVLDIACGTGVVTRAVAQLRIAGRVVGLDFNAAMLTVARALAVAGGSAIEWIEADALALPFPDKSFDVVLCQQGLQQIADRPTALREIRRVLVDDGVLVVNVWSRIERNPWMAAVAAALERHVGSEAAANRRAPFALGDANDLRRLLVSAGLRDVDVQTLEGRANFPSPEALVEYQLAATPLSTIGPLTDESRRLVHDDVSEALQAYVGDAGLVAPMEIHLAYGWR